MHEIPLRLVSMVSGVTAQTSQIPWVTTSLAGALESGGVHRVQRLASGHRLRHQGVDLSLRETCRNPTARRVRQDRRGVSHSWLMATDLPAPRRGARLRSEEGLQFFMATPFED